MFLLIGNLRSCTLPYIPDKCLEIWLFSRLSLFVFNALQDIVRIFNFNYLSERNKLGFTVEYFWLIDCKFIQIFR